MNYMYIDIRVIPYFFCIIANTSAPLREWEKNKHTNCIGEKSCLRAILLEQPRRNTIQLNLPMLEL